MRREGFLKRDEMSIKVQGSEELGVKCGEVQ
jgi:hypothetical protein